MVILNPKKIFGGFGFFEDDGYEKEKSAISSEKGQFSTTGSIEFSKNQAKEEAQRKEATSKRVFFQAVKEDQARVQQIKKQEQIEQEINDIGNNLSIEEKNRLLHYQASYRDRSIYQRAELRRKLIEERKNSDKQKKEASVAETKPGASALNAAMEGGSGSQGTGQANLSAQATG